MTECSVTPDSWFLVSLFSVLSMVLICEMSCGYSALPSLSTIVSIQWRVAGCGSEGLTSILVMAGVG